MTKRYCLVLLNCCPLFLHCLTSLIKLILWLKFFVTDERQAEDMGLPITDERQAEDMGPVPFWYL